MSAERVVGIDRTGGGDEGDGGGDERDGGGDERDVVQYGLNIQYTSILIGQEIVHGVR